MPARLRKASAVSAIIIIVAACLALLGGVSGNVVLKSITSGWPELTPNGAVGLLMAGVALLLLNLNNKLARLIAPACALLLLALAVLTQGEYLFDWRPGIDHLLLPATGRAASLAGRISPNEVVCFLLAGGALLLIDKTFGHGQRPAQYMALGVGLIALWALLGYLYGATSFYQLPNQPGMALHSSLLLVLLAAGILCARPEGGLMAVMAGQTIGGVMGRRLVLAVIVVPAALGWMKLTGQRLGYFEASVGMAMLMAMSIVVFLIVVWRNAELLHRVDLERQRAELELRAANLSLEGEVSRRTGELAQTNIELQKQSDARAEALTWLQRSREDLADLFENASVGIHMVGSDGIILRANRAELDWLGYTHSEYIGHHIAEFYADQQHIEKILAALARGEVFDNEEVRLRAKDGSLRHALVSSNVLWREGQFVYTRCFTRDITERQEVTERLRASEARFRTMADSAPVLIWMSGTDKLCTYFNKGWLEFTGRTMEQELNDGWAEGVHPEDYQSCLAIYGTAFDARREYHMEYRLRRYDGEYRWVFSHGAPLFLPDGAFTGYIGSCIDISGRRQVEQRLRESESLKQSVVDALPEHLAVLDRKGTIIAVNQAWQRFAVENDVDPQRGVGLGTNYLEACYQPDEEPGAENARAARQGIIGVLKGEQNFFTLEYPCDSLAEKRWFLMNVVPLRGGRGGAVVAHIDITARKRTEDLLRQSEERLRLATEAASVGLWFWEVTTNELIWTEQGKALFGLRPEAEISYDVFLDTLYPDDRAVTNAAVQQALRDGQEFNMEFRVVWPDGSVHWIAARGQASFDDNGRAVRMMGITRDVTDRKQIEDERLQLLQSEQRARARAEEAARLKDEFLAVVSHELRTPLNSMLGWTRLLRDGNLDQPSAARALETIERNARTQERIISDLLDVSSLSTGKLRLAIAPLDPAHVIEEAIETARPAAEARQITIQRMLDRSVPTVPGDANRLRQVVWHLLTNAIKFTPTGGRIQVRLARIGSFVEITVSDTGIGIKADFLPFVFDHFRQEDDGTNKKFGGLGLGLTIVRDVMAMHGGTVRAESAGTGQGATFILRLPVSQVNGKIALRSTPRHPDQAGSDCPPQLTGLKVLVVEHETAAREAISATLSHCQAEVCAAESVSAALAVLDDWLPDVLVADLEMLDDDGATLLRSLRKLEIGRTRKISAVALIAQARPADRLRALAAGFQLHLTKPVETEELLMIVAGLGGRLSYQNNVQAHHTHQR